MSLALLEQHGAIATITLNRPESRNALSIDLLQALHARVDELGASVQGRNARNGGEGGGAARVLVLTGAGTSFCAGMDLKQVLSDPDKPLELLGLLADLCVKIRELPCVTIAHVNGAAIGGLKVATKDGWFAARPSGTEDVYKIYAESFRSPEHLAEIQNDAREALGKVFAASGAG